MTARRVARFGLAGPFLALVALGGPLSASGQEDTPLVPPAALKLILQHGSLDAYLDPSLRGQGPLLVSNHLIAPGITPTRFAEAIRVVDDRDPTVMPHLRVRSFQPSGTRTLAVVELGAAGVEAAFTLENPGGWWRVVDASVTVLAEASVLARAAGPPDEYVRIGEGLTAASLGERIRAAYRMFSAPEMNVLCSASGTVARLQTRPEGIRLEVGRSLPLNTLAAVALGPSGDVIRDVPVAIDVQNVSPEILDLRSDRLESGPTPIRAGAFDLRIRTVCSGSDVETIIPIQVVP